MEWVYTRTGRQHRVMDYNFYKFKGECYHLFEIRNCTPYGGFNQKYNEGYNLLHKGKLIAHGKTVKELKIKAEEVNTK